MIARAASGILSFALPMYLSRRLSLTEFGTYKQFFLIAVTLLSVLQLGLAQSLYYFVPKDARRSGAYIGQAITLLALVGAGATIGMLALASTVAHWFRNPELAAVGLPLALHTGLMIFTMPLEVGLTARGRVTSAGIAYVASDVSRTVLLIGAAYLGDGVAGIAWAAVIYGLLRAAAMIVLAIRGPLKPARPDRQTLRAHLAYALSFAAAGFVIIGTSYFPQYAVSTCTDAATFAVFAVGTMQLPILDLLYTPVSEVMMVRLAQAEPQECVAIYHEATARLATFFFGLAAASWSLAGVLIPALFTYKFVAAVPLWMVAVLEMPTLALPVDGLLRSYAATTTILLSNLIRLGLMVPLTLLGLHFFSLMGAVAGFVCSQFVGRAVMLWQAKRLLGVTFGRLLPWRSLLATSGRAGVAAVPTVAVCHLVHATPKVVFAVGAAVFGVTYLAVLYRSGEIHEALGLKPRKPPPTPAAIESAAPNG